MGMCKLSADHKLLAYTVDKNGCEEFTLFVKDLSSGQVLAQHTVEGVVSVEWAQSEPSLFYTVADNLMRPFKYTSFVFLQLFSFKCDNVIYAYVDHLYCIMCVFPYDTSPNASCLVTELT